MREAPLMIIKADVFKMYTNIFPPQKGEKCRREAENMCLHAQNNTQVQAQPFFDPIK